MVEITAFSDTHGRHRHIDVPDSGELLIVAGDITKHGRGTEVKAFTEWLSQFDYDEILVTGGNHDFCLDRGDDGKAYREMLMEEANARLLLDDTYTYNGLTVFMSPFSATFDQYVFVDNDRRWDEVIPDDADIVVTHGPPHGRGDYVEGAGHIGSEPLRNRVDGVEPELHLYGHVHGHFGRQAPGSYNVSVLDEDYKPVNGPITVEVSSSE